MNPNLTTQVETNQTVRADVLDNLVIGKKINNMAEAPLDTVEKRRDFLETLAKELSEMSDDEFHEFMMQ